MSKTTITRKELAVYAAEKAGVPQAKAALVIASVIDTIAAALNDDQVVILRGLGRFESVAMPARMGRNPRTGEPAPIPAHRRVRFCASKGIFREDA